MQSLVRGVATLSRVRRFCATTLLACWCLMSGTTVADTLRIEGIYDGKGLTMSDGSRWYLRRLHLPDTSVLTDLIGQDVEFGPTIQNRYGEQIGNLYLANGVWLQGNLVAKGLALTDPFAAEVESFETDYQQLMRLENLSLDQVKAAEALALEPFEHRARFVVVEGTISEAATRTWDDAAVVYLNFGADYREDFTIRIRQPVLAAYRARLRELKLRQSELAGQVVRVRGLLQLNNGPSIDLQHPLALEFLGEFQGESLQGFGPEKES